MPQPPVLTDRHALSLHRARTQDDALFLHRTACDELQDRLTGVNKSFTRPAIVSPFPHIWTDAFPNAKIVPDTDTLDLVPGAHDLVIHALALHWANDPVGQIIQCRRALEADGLFMAVSFGGQTLSELRASLGQAEVDIAGGLSPRIAPMGEIRELGALLQRAGLALPVADSLPFTVSYASALHLMHDLRAMGENNALQARMRHLSRRTVLMRAADIYHETHAMDDGRVQATFDLIFLLGWAPDDSQPKPLRPGSAAARLADALGTNETPLKD